MARGETEGAGREETLRELAEATHALARQVEDCVETVVGHLYGTDPEVGRPERKKYPTSSFRDTLVGARVALKYAACVLPTIRDDVASTEPAAAPPAR